MAMSMAQMDGAVKTLRMITSYITESIMGMASHEVSLPTPVLNLSTAATILLGPGATRAMASSSD